MGVTPKAIGWFSSAERFFQTRHSIESFRKFHGEDVTFYLLFCGSIRDLDRISVPDYVKVVFPEQMNRYYVENIDRFGLMGGFPRCLIVDYMMSQNHDAIMALDGDTELFAPIDDLWEELAFNNAFVTPHRVYPPPRDGYVMCDEQFALCGNYNAGFCGFANTDASRKFVAWWLKMSLDTPECNMSAGRFAEQGWLRFIADYLDRVHICRDQGVNFAFWRYDNHNQFRKVGENDWTVDGTPLRLFHYGALDFKDLGRVAIHHNRCRACPDLLAFLERYRTLVMGS